MKLYVLALALLAGGALAFAPHGVGGQGNPDDNVPSLAPTVQAPAPVGDAQPDAVGRFLEDHRGARLYHTGQRITRVYGSAFEVGVSPEDTADRFRLSNAEMFGATSEDLDPAGLGFDEPATLPLMYDPATGDYKFTLVYYPQHRSGIVVFGSEMRLVVRNEVSYPLVLAVSTVRDLGDFAVGDTSAAASFDPGAAATPGLTSFTTPETVIWAGLGEEVVEPALAVKFIGDNYESPDAEAPEKWLFVADANTGEILYQEDLIIHTDVTGNVSGMATEGVAADFCEAEVATPMPYAAVNIQGGNSAYADQSGDFVIPNGGTSQVTVVSPMSGQYFYVNDGATSEEVLTQSVTPPGPANFMHNAANSSQYIRAEVNGYIQANVVRDFILTQNPSYPIIAGQTGFPVNVNLIGGYCPGNAWYDYSSINFCRAGSGYPNTAWSSIVHHEYGHHVVYCGGSGQGQYGEGMGDTIGVLIADDPGVGWGFFGSCNQPLRSAANNLQYPCNSSIHYCGQLLSGCVWSTRNELAVTNPSSYLDILSSLTINSVLLHSGTMITPQITIDFLTLDDDDANLGNGTPHSAEICAGFGAHNMDCPDFGCGEPADCDDGLFCNGVEDCVDTQCVSGSDPCPAQYCDEAQGCVECIDDVRCNDLDPCTTDSCVDGSCINTPIDCDDGDPCTDDSCDPATGCVNTPVVCPPGEECVAGNCEPTGCDSDGTCESGEDCNNCPGDCFSGAGGYCGNGVCETALGEDCLSCSDDCNGRQNGRPSGRYCCGDGDGENPVGCGDPQCTGAGNTCSDVAPVATCCGDGFCEGSEDGFNCEVDCGAPPICGDGTCDPGEDECNCSADCGPPPSSETDCANGVDEDCDGLTDCNDADCDADPACNCLGRGEPCSDDGECCSSRCHRGACK